MFESCRHATGSGGRLDRCVRGAKIALVRKPRLPFPRQGATSIEVHMTRLGPIGPSTAGRREDVPFAWRARTAPRLRAKSEMWPLCRRRTPAFPAWRKTRVVCRSGCLRLASRMRPALGLNSSCDMTVPKRNSELDGRCPQGTKIQDRVAASG
jgi:hypothetical protein